LTHAAQKRYPVVNVGVMQMLGQLQTLAGAHWAAIMTILGGWIAVATIIARGWPKPSASAPWYARAGHFVLVDLPSFAATLNGKTWMGLTVSIPFVTWTVRDPADPAARKQSGMVTTGVMLVLALLTALGLALTLAGCASAQKDTILAEMTLGKTVSLGYRVVDGIDKAKTDALHSEITAGKVAQARTEFSAYKPKIDKALAGLAAGADLLSTADTVRQAADKGSRNWKDFTAYLPQLASMAAQIEALIADLQAVSK
jgi:phage host-nuclease inhibitor protein Gam